MLAVSLWLTFDLKQRPEGREPEEKGELYCFAGKEVNTKKIAAAAWVAVVAETNNVTRAQASYQEEGGVSKLAEIRTASKTLRFL